MESAHRDGYKISIIWNNIKTICGKSPGNDEAIGFESHVRMLLGGNGYRLITQLSLRYVTLPKIVSSPCYNCAVFFSASE